MIVHPARTAGQRRIERRPGLGPALLPRNSALPHALALARAHLVVLAMQGAQVDEHESPRFRLQLDAACDERTFDCWNLFLMSATVAMRISIVDLRAPAGNLSRQANETGRNTKRANRARTRAHCGVLSLAMRQRNHGRSSSDRPKSLISLVRDCTRNERT